MGGILWEHRVCAKEGDEDNQWTMAVFHPRSSWCLFHIFVLVVPLWTRTFGKEVTLPSNRSAGVPETAIEVLATGCDGIQIATVA